MESTPSAPSAWMQAKRSACDGCMSNHRLGTEARSAMISCLERLSTSHAAASANKSSGSDVSWAMAYGVRAGRKAINFSEWAAYQPEEQQRLLAESCQDASTGKMPGPWTLLHPEAKLSTRDIELICGAAKEAELAAARGF